MEYFHKDINGQPIQLPVGKVVCVGRNYVDHVKELNNEVPDTPLLFMKPSTSLCDVNAGVTLPADTLGSCHNELEIAILIKSPLKNASQSDCQSAIWGVGLALDLTLRDLQSKLKSKGLPWERAKSFDGACPVSGFTEIHNVADLQALSFSLEVNQQLKQQGDTSLMMWGVYSLLSQISEVFTLLPGDIVLTGTPKGVGPLFANDELCLRLDKHFSVNSKVQGEK
ncbi:MULTISPECIES: fumarylacetoacetate hydrolase family protein [Alteromonadaceae]|uniref:fumarylacetoacetate hydrolase family protein n=1 Tax=Alteromonadaceae TaxID=72275 RepID=UPI001C098F91|nr:MULTISPECIES: fumarylacetoacetate hydrolase family protein [Aliiglaciecola]MBU2880074.1 fumarylacetoacetate hydrolase family protein [Aliiglaciecola lipolytica]MDO6710928.1 fumarylacetoacetate hydrolase family protein [Aliiglaciecola sp. 2_MG-2023]MDO6752409.1 fumarylacetoacetate hydrolase family protein [Aliiglaciecola sp. 1_MG-2023]